MPPADVVSAHRRVILATRNEGKVAEMVALLAGTDWQVARLPESIGEFEETGATFAENARGKALFAAAQLDAVVLADDSGLEIDALGGDPGVRSARYIDESLSQAARNKAVLSKMHGISLARRTARFVCHLALAHQDRVIHETTGVCEGVIAEKEHGEGGFGYDPLFLVPGLGLTFAQISRDEKSALSHRGRAVRAMTTFLRSDAARSLG